MKRLLTSRSARDSKYGTLFSNTKGSVGTYSAFNIHPSLDSPLRMVLRVVEDPQAIGLLGKSDVVGDEVVIIGNLAKMSDGEATGPLGKSDIVGDDIEVIGDPSGPQEVPVQSEDWITSVIAALGSMGVSLIVSGEVTLPEVVGALVDLWGSLQPELPESDSSSVDAGVSGGVPSDPVDGGVDGGDGGKDAGLSGDGTGDGTADDAGDGEADSGEE